MAAQSSCALPDASLRELRGERLHDILTELGQPVHFCPQPNGWPLQSRDWISKEMLDRRVRYAFQFSTRVRQPGSLMQVLQRQQGQGPLAQQLRAAAATAIGDIAELNMVKQLVPQNATNARFTGLGVNIRGHHNLFAACAAGHTAVEINCRPERLDPPRPLLQMAIEHGCWFSIDSDAHSTGQLEWQPLGCDRAAEMGVPLDRVINTFDVDGLLRWVAGQ